MSEHIDTFVVLLAVSIIQTFSLLYYDDFAKSHQRYYFWTMVIFTLSGIFNATLRNLDNLSFFVYVIFTFWFLSLAIGWKVHLLTPAIIAESQSVRVPDT